MIEPIKVDQTLEMLADSTRVQLHERLIQNIGTPKWEKDLFLLDEVLMQEQTARPGESWDGVSKKQRSKD